MTVTSPPSGPSVVRRGVRARARGVIAIAVLLVVGAPLAVAPAHAAPPVTASAAAGRIAAPQPTPVEPTPDVPTGVAAFTISPVANGIVLPGEGLAVSVTLQNGTAVATAPAAVTLSLGAAPLPDRAALTAWLAGDTAGVPVTPVGSTALEAVLPGAEQVNGIVVPAGDPVLAGRAPGVYPLTASYESAAGTVTSTSTMIVPPQGGGEAGIGVIVPITADATAGGLLTATELTELTAPTGSLTNQLDAVDGTAAILAIDPAILAAIRVLGSSAPASAVEWLVRLESLANSRFALQFGDADVAAQMQAGLSRPLPPLSLQAYIDPANFATPAPDTTPTPSPTATAAPSEPTTPSLAELVDIGGARAGMFWPATGTATPAVVAALGDLVADDRDSLTLVPSTSTAAGASGATTPGRSDAGSAGLIVYDADISRELHGASIVEETALRGAPLTAAAAYLSFAVAEAGGNPVVVTVDRGADRSRVALRTAITSATEAPGAIPLTLGGVATRAPASAEVIDAPVDQARVAAAAAFVAGEAQIARFATILDDTSLLTGPERAEILQLLGLGWLPAPVEWQTAVDLHYAETTTTLDSVGILPPSPLNLFSAGAPIPVWVRNDLPYPVTVVLYATPDDLRLDIAKATETTAGPDSNTRVQVPVQSRVGNGEVDVQLQLRSRTLEPIGAPQVVTVNVRADWEGAGVVVLSLLVGGFILLGVVRTILRLRRRRRARRGQATDAVTAGSDDADAAGGEQPTDPGVEPTATAVARNATDAGEGQR